MEEYKISPITCYTDAELDQMAESRKTWHRVEHEWLIREIVQEEIRKHLNG